MEGLQNLIAPSLQEILRNIQFDNLQNEAIKKNRKRANNNNDETGKKKRNRITFDATQIDEMEKVFAENQYPDASCRDQLASKIQLHEERVQIWFQNRRAKYRRELKHAGSSPNESDKSNGKKESEQIKNSIDEVVNNNNNVIKKPVEKVDSPASTKNSKRHSTDGSEENLFDPSELYAGQDVTAALSLLLNAGQAVNDVMTNTNASENNEDGVEMDSEENAKLIMLTLSHLFSIQNDAIFS